MKIFARACIMVVPTREPGRHIEGDMAEYCAVLAQYLTPELARAGVWCESLNGYAYNDGAKPVDGAKLPAISIEIQMDVRPGMPYLGHAALDHSFFCDVRDDEGRYLLVGDFPGEDFPEAWWRLVGKPFDDIFVWLAERLTKRLVRRLREQEEKKQGNAEAIAA